LLNRENGGLDDLARQQYLEEIPEFQDRSLLEVKFENAENILLGKRFYLEQEYDLIQGDEGRVILGHTLNFGDKNYEFRQSSAVSFFGDAFRNSNLKDRVKLRHIRNEINIG
jgi:hypothetical protein